MHICEEANLRHVKVKVDRSCSINLVVVGYNFYVAARFSVKIGWIVTVLCCREGDDTLKIPTGKSNMATTIYRTPF